jgi:hypothetical protein
MKVALPSITKIAYLPCSELSHDIQLRYKVKMPVAVYAGTTLVKFFDTPTCEAVMEYENKGRVEHTTLKFSTLDELPTAYPVAFVVTTANGRSYLIGAMERPFPVVKVEERTGVPAGEPAVKSVTVTLSAHKSLVPCIV